MSAWLVDDDTIDLLLTAWQQQPTRGHGGTPAIEPVDAQWRTLYPDLDNPRTQQGTWAGTLNDLGWLWLYQNRRSLQARYDDRPAGAAARDIDTFTYRFRPVALDENTWAATVLKSIHCLMYQACETNDWEKTWTYRTLHELEARVMREIPGYEEAPWGWTRRDRFGAVA